MKKLISLIIIILMIISAAILPSSAMPCPYSYGDVDGDDKITVLDATEIRRHLALLIELDDLRYELADFNGDGKVTIIDATDIQRYLAKLLPSTPRIDYLYALVKIDDVTPSKFSKRVQIGDEVEFKVDADIKYPIIETGPLKYDYTIVDIETKEEKLFENCGSTLSYTFDKAGLYRIDVEAYDNYGGYDKYIFQYEVVESYPFDEFLYVYYEDKYYSDYQYNGKPQMPQGCEISFEEGYSESGIYDVGRYITPNNRDFYDEFATIVKSKEQYDAIFKVENDVYDEQFFESNYLVGVYTCLSCHQASGALSGLAVQDGTLYVDIAEYIYVEPGMDVSPTTPGCILMAKVSKADVENVTDIEWTK